MQRTSIDILTTIARSLVVADAYPSLEDALQGLALAEVERKITKYRRRVRRLERKYGADFDDFTARLQNTATPEEEDDWLAWRSADRILADWQRAREELKRAGSRG